jgi:hypothetical protein
MRKPTNAGWMSAQFWLSRRQASASCSANAPTDAAVRSTSR